MNLQPSSSDRASSHLESKPPSRRHSGAPRLHRISDWNRGSRHRFGAAFLASCSRALHGLLRLWIVLACGLLLQATAISQEAHLELLRKADAIKTSDYPEFAAILADIERREDALSASEQRYLQYLRGWKSAYDGRYEAAIALLRDFIENAEDVTLRFRALATIVNVLALAKRYEDAYSRLTQLLAMLPQVADKEAREQALVVAAILYNQVGQYELAEKYADTLIAENESDASQCKAGQLRLEALYKRDKLSAGDRELALGIAACERAGESSYANVIRTFVARLHLEEDRPREAIALLERQLAGVRESRYPRLVSEFEALLAKAHYEAGDAATAREYALRALDNSVKGQITEPLVGAYRVLYEIARDEQNHALALEYHERLAATDKGYLDDISARQLAYQRVRHETLANELEIQTLNRQNDLLKLERENNRLYIALLISILGFIALWAYKTKRSQVHFMKLSQRDALTGIANRPYFAERAERILQADRKAGRETSIVVVDLDYFKAINDRYGHAAGDLVLKHTVATCESLLRPSDLFGRFGGEEFGILLSGCGLEVARQRCEQLRAAVSSVTAQEHGMTSSITASFGLSSTKLSGYDLPTLLAHADAALYGAKRAGRNRVMAFDPSMIAFGDEHAERAADERIVPHNVA